jgi:hypothetical protein
MHFDLVLARLCLVISSILLINGENKSPSTARPATQTHQASASYANPDKSSPTVHAKILGDGTDRNYDKIPLRETRESGDGTSSGDGGASSKTFTSSTAVPKELLRRLRDPEMYNKHALPTQDSGRC